MTTTLSLSEIGTYGLATEAAPADETANRRLLREWTAILEGLEATGVIDTPHVTLGEAVREAREAVEYFEALVFAENPVI